MNQPTPQHSLRQWQKHVYSGRTLAILETWGAVGTALVYLSIASLPHAKPGTGAFWGGLVGVGLLSLLVESLVFAGIEGSGALGCLGFFFPEIVAPLYLITAARHYYQRSSQSPKDQVRTLWSNYRTRSRNAQIVIGASTLLTACLVLSCVGTVMGSGRVVVSTPTPTRSSQANGNDGAGDSSGQVVFASTDTPVPVPTATSSPTATALPQPTATTPPPPPPAPTNTPGPSCSAYNGNPWCYNFDPNGGNVIYSPPGNFCTSGYFTCINNFWNGTGYVVQCGDGMMSKSGGHQGVCSYHKGYLQTLYAH